MKEVLKPINSKDINKIGSLINKYDRLESFKNYVKKTNSLHLCGEEYHTTINLGDFFKPEELVDKLNKLQEKVEKDLNSLGFTMDKEVKE